jgi:uncharacterized repeat protein (TIGR03803 family)
VILDPEGNLYGTTAFGSAGDAGLVYEVDTAGQYTALYSFTGGSDGGTPYAGVIRDSAGNLYGTTVYGGTNNAGVVYEVDGTGQETVLYNFLGYPDGANPVYGTLLFDTEGNLYGTTQSGGALDAGSLYKLDATGQETVLYSFYGSGYFPYAGVVRDPAGNLYGTTLEGGTDDYGVVYELDAMGLYTVLHNFTGGADGGHSSGGLFRDSAGNLYGTASGGGSRGGGVVFKLKPQ